MPIEKSMGYMLQGVSQQPAQIRRDGQVTEQINRVPDPVLGNTSRAGGERVGFIGSPMPNRKIKFFERAGVPYVLAYTTDASDPIRIFEMDGTEMPVNYDAGTAAYFGDDMSFYVYNKTLFCTNRQKVVEMDASIPTSALRQNEAVIRLFGGTLGQRYTVKIRDNNGEYNASTKLSESDVDNTNAGNIAAELVNESGGDNFSETVSINSVLPAYYTVVLRGSHIRIINTQNNSFDIIVSDNGAEDTITAVSKEVKDVADLPVLAPHGMYLKVFGDATSDDDYYMKFEVTDWTGPDASFGQSGAWVETAKAGLLHHFDLTTMPHRVTLNENTGEWNVAQTGFDPRKVGDDESNPVLDFVGRTITDIAEFQSRMVFASGPYVVMSKTDEATQFFKNSATQIIDTDPVSLRASKAGSIDIQWLIPFDRDLIALAPDAQLLVTGSSKMTSENGALVLTTGYNMSSNAKPATTGQTLLIPFLSGGYSGIQEFFTKTASVVNAADSLTATLSRYIEGQIVEMESSPSAGVAAMRTDATDQKTIYVYKYILEGDEKTQSAWGKWRFSGNVRALRFQDGYLYLVLGFGAYNTIIRVPPNRAIDDVGYHVTLDDKQKVTVTGRTIDLNIENAVFVLASGGPDIGESITPASITPLGSDTWTYTFSDYQIDAVAELWVGNPIYRELMPTMPVYKDYQNRPVVNARIIVNRFLLNYTDSGPLRAQMLCKWRDAPTDMSLTSLPVSDDPYDPDNDRTREGIWAIPWGERAERSELRLTSIDHKPDTLLELLWRGQVQKKGGRV